MDLLTDQLTFESSLGYSTDATASTTREAAKSPIPPAWSKMAGWPFPVDLRLADGESLFSETGGDDRIPVMVSGDIVPELYIPSRHWYYLRDVRIRETYTIIKKDKKLAYHGQYPYSADAQRCDGPICRYARNEIKKSRPYYTEKHSKSTPRPRRHLSDIAPLMWLAQFEAYSDWLTGLGYTCVPDQNGSGSHVIADPQARVAYDTAGNRIKVLEITEKERSMRRLLGEPEAIKKYLLSL